MTGSFNIQSSFGQETQLVAYDPLIEVGCVCVLTPELWEAALHHSGHYQCLHGVFGWIWLHVATYHIVLLPVGIFTYPFMWEREQVVLVAGFYGSLFVSSHLAVLARSFPPLLVFGW